MSLTNLAPLAAAATGAGASATATTPSFTPSAGALVVIAVGAMDNQGNTSEFSVSDTIGGLIWTQIDFQYSNNFGSTHGSVVAFWAVAGASPPAGTVTVTKVVGSSTVRMTIRPFGLTGQAPSPITNVGKADTGGTSSGTFTYSPGFTPNVTSQVVYVLGGYINAGAPTVTDDSHFTQAGFDSSDGWSWLEVAYCNGSAPTVAAPSFSASSLQENAIIIFEVVPPAPPATPRPARVVSRQAVQRASVT